MLNVDPKHANINKLIASKLHIIQSYFGLDCLNWIAFFSCDVCHLCLSRSIFMQEILRKVCRHCRILLLMYPACFAFQHLPHMVSVRTSKLSFLSWSLDKCIGSPSQSLLPSSLFFWRGPSFFLWKCFHLTTVNNLSTFSTAPHNYQWTLQINFSCTSYEEFLNSSLLCNFFHSTTNSWWIFSWATWLKSVVEFQVFQSLANPQQSFKW